MYCNVNSNSEFGCNQKKQKLTMYTDLCLRVSLYSSFTSGKGLSGDLLTLVLSSLISKRPVFDFWRAATMTLVSVVKDFSLGKRTQVLVSPLLLTQNKKGGDNAQHLILIRHQDQSSLVFSCHL